MVGVTLRQELQAFRRVWDISMRFGVQAAVVWEMVPKLRPIVRATADCDKNWGRGYLAPADFRSLLFLNDFPFTVRAIVRDDARWWVWANDIHTSRYVERDLATSFDRVWARVRPGVLAIERELLSA